MAGAGGWIAHTAAGSRTAPPTAVRVGSAPVIRTDLATTTQVSGTLGYAGSYQVISQTTGTALTALPRLGAVVRRGRSLFEVDGNQVPLLYGQRPMYRPIQAGMTPGPDVYQLDRNLIALGYTDGGYLTPTATFTAATAAAIGAWQAARGGPATGALQLGDVVFEPGPVRVTALAAAIGSPVQPGTAILTATSTRRSVDVALPVGQEYLVRRGDAVTVTLPDGTSTTPGVVTAVAPVATSADSNGGAAGNDGAAAGGPASAAASGQGGTGPSGDTVDVTVTLTRPATAGGFDQAPVEVNIVAASASNVLAVPIDALTALAGGGYAVRVESGQGWRLLGVRTGLFSDTLVQVSGAGLQPGVRVEVPSQ